MAKLTKKKLLIVVVGLPAAGKSHYASERAQKNKAVVVDDVRSKQEIIAAFKTSSMVYVTSPFFCRERIRERIIEDAKENGWSIKFIFFENDPEQCLINAKRRDKNVDFTIKKLTKEYFPPKRALKVWREKSTNERRTKWEN